MARDLVFGNVLVETISDTLTFTIKNYGTEDLNVTSISDPGEPYSLIDLPEVPVNIPPNQSLAFKVIFSPTIEGRADAKVTISSNDANDPVIDVLLSGRGFILNPAEAGVYYGTLGNSDPNAGGLITIDISTGAGNLIGLTGVHSDVSLSGIQGLTINSKGEIFAADIGNSSNLYRIDAASGAALFIATTGLTAVTALAFDSDDILYAADIFQNIYIVNTSTGEPTLIDNTGIRIRGLAFDPADGQLYASDNGNRIYKVDIVSGEGKAVGNTDHTFGTPDIFFDDTGNLYGSVGGGVEPNNLISIDKYDGKGTLIGPIGFTSVSGMATRLDTFWMVTPQTVSINNFTLVPGVDTLEIQSKVTNPNGHVLTTKAIVESYDLSISDTLLLFDDGAHHDSSAGDNIFGGSWPAISGHGYFNVSINSYPTAAGYLNNYFHNAAQFTTAGPVSFDQYTITSEDTIVNPGDVLSFEISLRNDSVTDTVINITASAINLDTCTAVQTIARTYDDIAPGEIAQPNNPILIAFLENCPAQTEINFALDIYSDGYLFWSDTFTVFVDSIVSSIEKRELNIPMTYALEKNFPNPFNPTTTIGYQLPYASDVELSIYNLLGQKVTTLVSKRQSVGYYQVDWNASSFASGIYYYRLVAYATESGREKPFVETKKLILVK